MNGPEREALVAATRAALPSHVPVLAGIGAPSTYQALDYLERVLGAGADALLALSLPGGADQLAYYEALAKQAGSTPLLAYNYPGASAPGIPVEVLVGLPGTGREGLERRSGSPHRVQGALRRADLHRRGITAHLGGRDRVYRARSSRWRTSSPRSALPPSRGDGTRQASIAEPNRRAKSPFPAGIKELAAERFHTPLYRRMG